MIKLKEGSYFIRLAVSFLALATIALSLGSFVIYKNYEREVIKENKTVSEEMLSQAVYGADLIWDWASMHAIELYNNGYVRSAIYDRDITPIDEMKAQKVLSDAMSSNPYIYSIYLYNENEGKVYSTLSAGYTFDEFYDQDILKIIKNRKLYSQYHFIPRKVNFVHYDKEYEEEVLSLIATESLGGDKPISGALILNIKVSTIKNLIESSIPEKGNFFAVFDEKGMVISHTKPGLFKKDYSNEGYVETIMGSVKNSGYFTDKIDGKEYLVTFVKSDKLNWSFAKLKPYKDIFEKTYGMRSIIILLVLFIFLLIVFFSLWLSWRFYKPYNKAVENSDSLRRQYNDNREFLRREFMKNLLSGELSNYNVPEKFKEFGIKLNPGFFNILLIQIDDYKRDFLVINNEKDAGLLKFAVVNIASDILSEKYICEAVDMGADLVAVILNSQKEFTVEDMQNISDMTLQIRMAVDEYYGFKVSGALSQQVSCLHELPFAYSSALENAGYRLIYGKGVFITYNMVSANINNEYTYPDDIENDIVTALKTRNFKVMEQKTLKFFSDLKDIAYADMLMSVNRLVYASMKTVSSISGKKKPEYNYKSFLNRIESLDTLEDMCCNMLLLFKEFCDDGNDIQENIKKKHIDKVIGFVKAEYSDINLSSDSLAERLGLSSNYLREIFRESVGVTLSNYINEFRCEKAGEMLLETNLSIAEISEKIGLSNQNYFFTLFKKFKGLTPQQYRNKGKGFDE